MDSLTPLQVVFWQPQYGHLNGLPLGINITSAMPVRDLKYINLSVFELPYRADYLMLAIIPIQAETWDEDLRDLCCTRIMGLRCLDFVLVNKDQEVMVITCL
jgi:hypothetical protein